jgi:hypothetical protein
VLSSNADLYWNNVNGTSGTGLGIGTTSVGSINGTAFGGMRLHVVGSGNIGRLCLQGNVQGTMLMNASGGTANQRIKFIQSKTSKFRMGKVADNGSETSQFSIDDSGNCEIDTNEGALILRDSSGTRYAVTVDGGELQVNQL